LLKQSEGVFIQSVIRTGARLQLKVYDGNEERLIGYCTAINYTVSSGQKSIYVVDSPFPAEIAQGAGPSQVRGSMTIYMLQNTTPEILGLVPFRTSGTAASGDLSPSPGDSTNMFNMAYSKSIFLRLYDRNSGTLFTSLDYLKVGSYSVAVTAKGIVKADLAFEARYATPGQG
jgi:hypothetical protein